ncbi:MAG: hypothetical protein QNJ94_15500 [Alphaproteobacteria bacterium]|nr:hypothetical protein [Alphaproteobacteria bacterium]
MKLLNPRGKLLFFAIGIAAAAIEMAMFIYWMDLARWLAGDPRLMDHQIPTWLWLIGAFVRNIFWWAGAVILVANIRYIQAFEFPSYVAGGLVFFVTVMATFYAWYRVQYYAMGESFDAAAWKSPHPKRPHIRLRMIDDLLSRYELEGMREEAVIRLLGPTDDTSYFSRWDYVYWLGPERGYISIDSEWLVLRASDGKISEFAVVRD